MRRNAEVFILAGGFGARLRPVVADVPKPMAPVAGRPFLERLMEYWLGQGVERFVLSIGYKAEVIRTHFGGCFAGIPVSYVEEKEPLGTGGALALALRTGELANDDFVILNGDTWFELSLDTLRRDAECLNQPVTMAIKPMPDATRYGGVTVDAGGRVMGFTARGAGGVGMINAGCCLVRRDVIEKEFTGYPERFSLEADWLPGLAARGGLGVSVQDAPFIDIGVPEDYFRFCELCAEQG